MRRHQAAFLVAAVMAWPAGAASLTVAGLVDGDHGRSVDLDGHAAITRSWSVGAGIGDGEASLEGDDFSGNSLRASTDVQLGALFINASGERWRDSGQLRSLALRGELGWMQDSGFAFSALVADRSLEVTYSANVRGQLRQRDIRLDGMGLGAGLAWFGDAWTASLRYVGFSYGQDVARMRAAIAAADTVRFPRVGELLGSMATRAASAADREVGITLARQFAHVSLGGDLQVERDALTGADTRSLGVTLGLAFGRRVGLDTTVGLTDGGASTSEPWASVAVTLRTAPR
ncbi:MAG: hypothetical protein ABW278_04620 [Steroidobacteraceae bacterium]